MSREYVTTKIKEALKIHKGNAAQARQQIMSWAMQDPKLLRGLANPHMTGIVAHAVNHVLYGKGVEELTAVPPDMASGEKDESFGMDILRAIAEGETAQFGLENTGRPVGKRAASDKHVDAIRKMVGKGHFGDNE